MIWIALILVVFYCSLREFVFTWVNETPLDYFMGFVYAILPTFLAAGVAFGLAILCGLPFDTHPVKCGEHLLVVIRDKDGIAGSFFLGSGSIRGEQRYFFYQTNADGSYQPDSVKADDSVRVYEESRQDASMTQFAHYFVREWAYLFACPHESYTYEFRVPVGTVKRGYSM